MCDIFCSNTFVKISDRWYDLSIFLKIHPGGKNILRKYHKKDATEKFFTVPGHYNYLHTLDDFLIRDEKILNKLNNIKQIKLN
jgi:cytochrome b involved in lipid metabolism